MEFPAVHVQFPQISHTHTAILLHGRGSNGPEFAEELFSCMTSQNQNLASSLPHWRWVFPTSRDRWSTTFEEEMCAWFDAYSLDDIQARQDLQIDGLRESVLHILDILEREIRLLDGNTSHVYLGGISQGMATALWTLLCATARIKEPLGGVLVFCGWLPFAQQVEDMVQKTDTPSGPGESQLQRVASGIFHDTIAGHGTSRVDETPVFLSHGTDDAWVSVELGRQAFRVLQQILVHVEWNEFTGAEGDGHWLKEPEGFDQVLRFLEQGSNQDHATA